MSYQTAKTIVDVVRGVQNRAFVLPDIQREFVWTREQIEDLFDSLMRGYPIGSFLFWELHDVGNKSYNFYDFVADYDVRSPHNERADLLGGNSVIAVLDGQQRLTAMNIALRGSFREKTPRLRWDNPAAFPKRQLYLDLLNVNTDAAPDERMYDFSFRTDDEVAHDHASGQKFWLRVRDVLPFKPNTLDYEKPLKDAGIAGSDVARENAFKLTQLLHRTPVVSYYLETEDDLDKVLNIFIRVNRGGTKLSYSDLLMSVATAKWDERDAREEVHRLVDDLNDIGEGFSFSRDRVLKAALVLSDLTDIRLKAKNMLDHMLVVEEKWETIRKSLLLGARLLAQFGLSRDTLTAENVLIPVAYYVQRRQLGDQYLTAPATRDDRERIRLWAIRSLLRSGFWTGSVDPILVESRKVITKHGFSSFPLAELETALEAVNKSLRFAEGEIDDLLRVSYKSPRSIPVLTLLYGDAVLRNAFHTDHVFARALLRRRSLTAALKSTGRRDDVDLWLGRVDQLPNLQLLTAAENTAKSDLTPSEWARTHLDAATRDFRLAAGDLDPLPTKAEEFFEWWESRRAAQEARLRAVLGVPAPATATGSEAEGADSDSAANVQPEE